MKNILTHLKNTYWKCLDSFTFKGTKLKASLFQKLHSGKPLIYKALLTSALTACTIMPVTAANTRTSSNIASVTANSEDFFLEKQKHDGALASCIDFYPMDAWYFFNLMRSNKDLLLMNTYDTSTRELYGMPESSFMWYQDIADGNYPEYRQFAPYAQYVVAKCLREQCGTVKNYQLSREYAEKSFNSGFAGAYLLIAEEIEQGWASKTTARYRTTELYQKAQAQDFPESYIKLAELASGDERRTLLNKAMEFNYSKAYFLAALDVLNSNTILNEELIVEKLETASVLLEEAEKLYHAQSAMLLGDLYARRICAKTDYSSKMCELEANPFNNKDKALEYYTNAAMYGEKNGFAALAAIYREGFFGETDRNMASFYYNKYRDAQYDEQEDKIYKMEYMRTFYEDKGNEPDETVCAELGKYYLSAEHPENTKTGAEWLKQGAGKGSAICMLALADTKSNTKDGLELYKQSVSAAPKYPLSASQKETAMGAIDDIYAQVIHGLRFKNDVNYWNVIKNIKEEQGSETTPSISEKPASVVPLADKPKISKDIKSLSIAPKTEALDWFKSRASDKNALFYRTWYAWLLVEDMEAAKYGIPQISKRTEKDMKDAWSLINDILSKDSKYAPAIVLKGRCIENGWGTGTRKKPKEARDCYEQAAKLNYPEAWGFLYNVAYDKAEMEAFLSHGCKALDEQSLYHAYSKLLWLPGQSDVTESLINSVDYGYLPSYMLLVEQYMSNLAVTFDNNFDKLDTAYNLAKFCEKAGNTKAKAKRTLIENKYGDNMTYTLYGMQAQINTAKRAVSNNPENADALYNLAFAYEEAIDFVDSAEEMAAEYYLMAAKLGSMEASEKIADCYFYGKGTEISYANAFMWYNAAQLIGDDNVYRQIGRMLINGMGCSRDVDKGLGYYKSECRINPESVIRKEYNCFLGEPEDSIY